MSIGERYRVTLTYIKGGEERERKFKTMIRLDPGDPWTDLFDRAADRLHDSVVGGVEIIDDHIETL